MRIVDMVFKCIVAESTRMRKIFTQPSAGQIRLCCSENDHRLINVRLSSGERPRIHLKHDSCTDVRILTSYTRKTNMGGLWNREKARILAKRILCENHGIANIEGATVCLLTLSLYGYRPSVMGFTQQEPSGENRFHLRIRWSDNGEHPGVQCQ